MTLIQKTYKENPMLGMQFEQRMFSAADLFIKAPDGKANGYGGGQWSGEKFSCSGKPGGEKNVRLMAASNGCDVMTDIRTATAAVCVMVLNHEIWRYHERGNESAARFFDGLWREANDAVYDDPTLDHAAIATFLD